ncbi:MAG: hypothetical protein NT169_28440 [Chloroflexi bacterium]|nr:hypothetical protein [Chloroflexota bacterium]
MLSPRRRTRQLKASVDDPDLRWLHNDARFWALLGQPPPIPSTP